MLVGRSMEGSKIKTSANPPNQIEGGDSFFHKKLKVFSSQKKRHIRLKINQLSKLPIINAANNKLAFCANSIGFSMLLRS